MSVNATGTIVLFFFLASALILAYIASSDSRSEDLEDCRKAVLIHLDDQGIEGHQARCSFDRGRSLPCKYKLPHREWVSVTCQIEKTYKVIP